MNIRKGEKMSRLSKDDKSELDKIIIQSDELKKKVRIRVSKKNAYFTDEYGVQSSEKKKKNVAECRKNGVL